MFTVRRGGLLARQRLYRLFRKLNMGSALPPVRLHDLRHRTATLALAAGVELKVVRAMLGHASIVLTANTYSSVLPGVAREADLVECSFAADSPNRLWVTDITEHPTREGKVYCAVVLDVCSRRVVGWAIDSSPTAALVTNALGMAIDNREPSPGTVIYSDHGV
ncbi:transposase InsO family protein [Nocardiopsis arvandica]|uniref:Transposase InsO family protein n=1 Tax=Nocardiopsis sinuspersici TaxID=501010 RepID=A0A7Y9X8W9_9ACTN|nr:transposase InsO family protein [Nocardiopsis sinuspersici]